MAEFITQGPLDPASNLFVGRRAELERIASWVKINSCVGCIAGARQTGKTTLLQRACREFAGYYVFVPVDLQSIEGASVADCLSYIASEIAESVPDFDRKSAPLPDSSTTFLTFLRAVASSTSAVRIAVTLDEFGALPDDTAVKLAHTLRAAFTNRNMKPELKRYCFILAGALDLRRIMTGRNSPLKNVTQSIYVPDLNLAEVAGLLRAGGFEDAHIAARSENIYAWTNGHPYWTQLIASRLVETGGDDVRSPDVNAEVENLLVSEDINLPHLIRSLSDGRALDVLLAVLKGDRVAFSRSDPMLGELELIGAIRNEEGTCRIRNRIYERALRRAFSSAPTSATVGREQGQSASSSAPIFVSYARADSAWLKRLQTALKPVLGGTNVSIWDDSRIQPGAQWRREIDAALSAAQAAVLLVSQDFLASDFVVNNELPPLLKAATIRGLKILWIPVAESTYERTPIAEYQALHSPKQPLDSLTPAARKRALVEIARKIFDVAVSSTVR